MRLANSFPSFIGNPAANWGVQLGQKARTRVRTGKPPSILQAAQIGRPGARRCHFLLGQFAVRAARFRRGKLRTAVLSEALNRFGEMRTDHTHLNPRVRCRREREDYSTEDR